MTEEQAFLSAITANPDDRIAQLACADWLQDNDDPRAEVVRLRVRVAALEDGWIEARERLTELEKIAPPKWLVQLDGPVWCIAGNVVGSRPSGPGGTETSHGTRLFKPNAKVYLADISYWRALWWAPEVAADHRVQIVGRHRKSGDWIQCIVRADYVTNWRVELVYQPGALVRLKKEGWTGFQLPRGAFVCPEDKSSYEARRRLLAALGAPVPPA